MQMPKIHFLRHFLAALGSDEYRANQEVKDGHFMLALIVSGKAEDEDVLARLLVMAERGYFFSGEYLTPGGQKNWGRRESELVINDVVGLQLLVAEYRTHAEVALGLVL